MVRVEVHMDQRTVFGDHAHYPLLYSGAISPIAIRRASSPRVALVNQTFVMIFGGVNPIGRTIRSIAEPNYSFRRL